MKKYSGTIISMGSSLKLKSVTHLPLKIANAEARNFLPGDIVEFLAQADEVKGELNTISNLKYISRKEFCVTGTASLKNGNWVLTPDEMIPMPIFINNISYLNPDCVISVKIDSSYKGSRAHANLIGVIGPRSSDLDFVCQYFLEKNELKSYYSFDVIQDIKKNKLEDKFSKSRIDLSDLCFFTIDEVSTQDMDDAVCIEPVSATEGNLYIAISDVSALIAPSSLADKHALNNCTSVYLPSKTVHMLPPDLALKELSLRPNEKKAAIVFEFKYSLRQNDVNITFQKFQRASITSSLKANYQQVDSFLNGDLSAIPELDLNKKLKIESQLQILAKITTLLKKSKNYYDFFSLENQQENLVFDEGKVVSCNTEGPSTAHSLVEELMLLVNGQAAILMESKKQKIYRHQDRLDLDALKDLLSKFDIVVSSLENISAYELFELATTLDDKKSVEFLAGIKQLIQPAEYSIDKKMHYTLGMSEYTQISSPIRRYSDLMAHRILFNNQDIVEFEAKVEKCSLKYKQARQAERLVYDFFKKKLILNELTQSIDNSIVDKMLIQAVTSKSIKLFSTKYRVSVMLMENSLKESGFVWADNKWMSSSGSYTYLKDGDLVDVSILDVVYNKSIAVIKARLA